MYEFVILTVFPLAVIFAASMDLVSMTIPNRISLFLVYSFLAVFPFAGDPSLERFLWHVAAGMVVFIPTFILFALRVLGGGDVKLLAAIALWVGWDNLPEYLINAALFGGLLAVALLMFRAVPLPLGLLKQSWITRHHKPHGDIPYGLALSAAALVVYPETVWFARLAT